VLLAAIATAGSSMQGIGVQVEIVLLLQGLIFLSVTAGEFFVSNRVGWRGPAGLDLSHGDGNDAGDDGEVGSTFESEASVGSRS
jgi:hypothetical protein